MQEVTSSTKIKAKACQNLRKNLLEWSQKHAKMVVQSIEHVRLTKRIALQVHETCKQQPTYPKTEIYQVRIRPKTC